MDIISESCAPLLMVDLRALLANCWIAEVGWAVSRHFSEFLVKFRCGVDDVMGRAGSELDRVQPTR